MDIDQIDGEFNLDQFDGNEDLLFGTLSIEDWTTIENLKSSFLSLVELPDLRPPLMTNPSDLFPAFLTWSNFNNQLAMRFIHYFRQINEFEQLTLDDRVHLVKYNLLPAFPIYKCYNYKDGEFPFPSRCNEAAQQHQQMMLKNGVPIQIFHSARRIIAPLVQTTEKDPALLAIIVVVLFFTPGLSLSEDEPILTDPLAVHRIQSYYTKILWNFLINQSGELLACRRFLQLTILMSRIQLAAKDLRMFFWKQCTKFNAEEQITPLMQSVLNIS